MEFTFSTALPGDDPALRRLCRENPMAGTVTLTYEREPDYFLACDTLGSPCQVLVARHEPDGEVAGVICRSVRSLYVNGVATDVGYISQLRISQQYRGRWLMHRAMRLWRELHGDGRVPAYLATVTEGNREAMGVLVDRPRRYLPAMREVDRVVTLALLLRRRPRGEPVAAEGQSSGVTVSRATAADLPAVVGFMRGQGPAKQFFPAYTVSDFGGGLTRGFSPQDFLVARSGSDVVGCLGLWDQAGYKQTVVQSYQPPLRWSRPVYNGWARLAGTPPLPAPGRQIRHVYGSFICVAGNAPPLFRKLLAAACELAAERGYSYLMVGFASRDPLLPVAERLSHIAYYSRLYTVCWEDGVGFHEGLDQRIPYVEIAAL